MLLQDIFLEENKDKKELFGIVLNSDSSKIEYHTPPSNFEMLGFILDLDEEGLIKDDLLDVLINYRITNTQIMIEVPSQLLLSKKIDAKYLLQLSSNVDFMISVLPPNHIAVGNTVTDEEYSTIIEDFTKELLLKPNFDKFICPISSFMEYLMLETLLGDKEPAIVNFKPQDPYIINTFVNNLSEESSNLFKGKIRNTIYDFYGSKEDFEDISSLMFKNIESKSEEIFLNHTKSQNISNNE